ncbi:MAG: hypothetical protein MK138_18775, partial [Planctomycetes bacterium]|nr:hypothetical protein [Planctomycetota bacterium]
MKKTLLILTALLAAGADSALADTVELRNGRVIHGKVIGEFPASGPVTVTFTGGGSLTLDPGSILSVRRDTRCDFKVSPGKPANEKPRKVQESAGGKPGTSPKKPEEKKKPVQEAEEGAGIGGAPVDPLGRQRWPRQPACDPGGRGLRGSGRAPRRPGGGADPGRSRRGPG